MAPSRPDIPKKLVARILGAQARVTALRDSLIHNHKRRLQAQAELDVFHHDPEAYAADRYGNHGVDSYPVQTRTSRLADDVAYSSSRISEIERDLPDAEAALIAVEADVLAEVLAMRPSRRMSPLTGRNAATAMQDECRLWAGHDRPARHTQISTDSAIANASSSSTPR